MILIFSIICFITVFLIKHIFSTNNNIIKISDRNVYTIKYGTIFNEFNDNMIYEKIDNFSYSYFLNYESLKQKEEILQFNNYEFNVDSIDVVDIKTEKNHSIKQVNFNNPSDHYISVLKIENDNTIPDFIKTDSKIELDEFENPIIYGKSNNINYIFHNNLFSNESYSFIHYGIKNNNIHEIYNRANEIFFNSGRYFYYIGFNFEIDNLEESKIIKFVLNHNRV